NCFYILIVLSYRFSFTFSLHCTCAFSSFPSFPTRRSSDLKSCPSSHQKFLCQRYEVYWLEAIYFALLSLQLVLNEYFSLLVYYSPEPFLVKVILSVFPQGGP